MKHRKLFALLTLFACMISLSLVLSACGDDEDEGDSGGETAAQTQEAPSGEIQRDEANAGTTITVGSKNFTEQIVLGEIYAQALEAAGYQVEKKLNLGSEVVAFGVYSGTYTATGRFMRARFVHHWTVVDGKVVRFEQYTRGGEIVVWLIPPGEPLD